MFLRDGTALGLYYFSDGSQPWLFITTHRPQRPRALDLSGFRLRVFQQMTWVIATHVVHNLLLYVAQMYALQVLGLLLSAERPWVSYLFEFGLIPGIVYVGELYVQNRFW